MVGFARPEPRVQLEHVRPPVSGHVQPEDDTSAVLHEDEVARADRVLLQRKLSDTSVVRDRFIRLLTSALQGSVAAMPSHIGVGSGPVSITLSMRKPAAASLERSSPSVT